MKLKQKLQFIPNILDLIFPIYCIGCGKEKEYLCALCGYKLPRLTAQKCVKCSLPSPFGKTHPECASKNVIDGIISALDYNHPAVKESIRIYKYKFIESMSTRLAGFIIEAIQNQNLAEYFTEFKIIPVPLHRDRFMWRGFNQSEQIAQILSDQLSISVDPKAIMRTINTKPQAKLSLEQRKKNIDKAFKINSFLTIHDKYLLVDDVAASGATLNEMAKTLKASGAKEIWAATIARG